MPYLGEWTLESTLTFYLDTTIPDTGASQDAFSLPSYRIYDAVNNTPVYQSSMARIDNQAAPSVTFTATPAAYLKLVALSEYRDDPYTSCAEFQVFAGTQIPPSTMSVVSVDSYEANGTESFVGPNAIDNNISTAWHTEFVLADPPHPHTLILALGATYAVDGFFYLPYQYVVASGTIANYEVYLSLDGITWGSPVASGLMPLVPPTTTTVGWYAAQVALQASSGFLSGRRYSIRMQTSVGGIGGATHHTFRIAALPATTVTPAQRAWRAAISVPTLAAGGALRTNPARLAWSSATARMERRLTVVGATLAWKGSPQHLPVDPEGRRGRLIRRPRRIGWRFATRPGLGNVLRHDHPLVQGLVSWWLTRGWMTKGLLWYDLLGAHPGRMISMGHSSTSGWGGTTRLGGHGEVRFDGVDDYVDMGPGLAGRLALSTDFTLSAWVFLRSFGGGSLGRLIDKRGSDSAAYAFLVDDLTGTGTLSLTINGGGGGFGVDSATTVDGVLTTGRWTHVMVTVAAASTVTFYVNGQAVSQRGASGVFNQTVLANTNSLQLGGAPNRVDRYFDGVMDDVRIWRRRLSPTDAQLVYTNSLIGSPGLLQPPHPLWIMVSPAVAIVTPGRSAWRAATALMRRTFVSTPGRSAWRAATARAVRIVQVPATQRGWKAATVITPRGFTGVVPRRMGMRAVLVNTGHFIHVIPARMG